MAPLTEDYMKSVSESQLKDRAYTPFEIAQYERDSLEDIKKCLKNKKYKDVESLKESLEFIEKLANKMNEAVNNEKKENKTTWELEADLADVKKIFEELDKMLQSLEQQENEKSNKKSRLNFRKK